MQTADPAPRGGEYDLDRLDELEEDAENASKDQIYKAIDHLVVIFNNNGIDYGLAGGVAMQLHGREDRETGDANMVASVKIKDLLHVVETDPK